MENYLITLPFKQRKILAKFRTSNNNLPIESGRRRNIDRNQRICTLCNTKALGDEFHYILECLFFSKAEENILPFNTVLTMSLHSKLYLEIKTTTNISAS